MGSDRKTPPATTGGGMQDKRSEDKEGGYPPSYIFRNLTLPLGPDKANQLLNKPKAQDAPDLPDLPDGPRLPPTDLQDQLTPPDTPRNRLQGKPRSFTV
jgi:hypothetical protein